MGWPSVGPNMVKTSESMCLDLRGFKHYFALGPLAFDPIPAQATTAVGDPAALTDKHAGVPCRSLGILVVTVRRVFCRSGTLILDDAEDQWLQTTIVGSIIRVVPKLEVIVLRTYHCRALGVSVLSCHSDFRIHSA